VGPNDEITVTALVDAGATYTWLPAAVLRQLGVQPVRKERFRLENGRIIESDVGFVTARLEGKEGPTLCVFGDDNTQPLIGAFTLEAVLLAVDPANKRLVPMEAWLV
jgi:predicted aspartyl protease